MKKIMMIFAVLFAVAGSSFAATTSGYLVEKSRIISVTNCSSNNEEFQIIVEGGEISSTVHSNQIWFRRSSCGTELIYKMAYTAALHAMSTGAPVDVFNYDADNPYGASFIRVHAK